MALTTQYSYSRIDYDGEKGKHGFRTTTLTALNFDAQAALQASYAIAVSGICLGSLHKHTHGQDDFQTNIAPADPLAQRENKWLVTYEDTTTHKLYRIELACADLTNLDPEDRKHAAIGDAAQVDAYVTAFEAFAVSEVGNPVSVLEITFVGRNV